MAITVSVLSSAHVYGDERVTLADIVLDSSYPTGGYALTAAQLNMVKISHTISVVKVAGANGPVNVHFDGPTGKLITYSATGQVANTTDLPAATVQITAFGY